MNKQHKTTENRQPTPAVGRRQLLGAVALTAPVWVTPALNMVLLPAHAQTSPSRCIADTTYGGPLSTNPWGATNCTDACEAQAADLGVDLCSVSETATTSGDTECFCEMDTR